MSARLHQVRLSPSWSKSHIIASSTAQLLAILLISSPGAAYLESWTPQQTFGLFDCSGPAWFIDPSTGHDSLPLSLRSGPVQTVGKSSLCRNVTAPASISWWWKAEGDGQRLGQLRFLVDGEVKYVCSSTDWSYAAYTVRKEGEHTVSWEYYKIKSYPEYAGAGWIDDLAIESQAPWVPPVIEGANIVVSQSIFNMPEQNSLVFNTTNISIPSISVSVNPSSLIINSSHTKMESFDVTANYIEMETSSANISIDQVYEDSLTKIVNIRADHIELNSTFSNLNSAACATYKFWNPSKRG